MAYRCSSLAEDRSEPVAWKRLVYLVIALATVYPARHALEAVALYQDEVLIDQVMAMVVVGEGAWVVGVWALLVCLCLPSVTPGARRMRLREVLGALRFRIDFLFSDSLAFPASFQLASALAAMLS